MGTRQPAEIAARVLAVAGPAATRESWPLVSIIVPTHEGLELLQRLVAGLEQVTDYPAFELVVVDNASTDGTAEWLRDLRTTFGVRRISNPRNLSFSAACNQGTAHAAGDLVLFLNNDIEPAETGWLRRLVTSLLDADAAAAGAILFDPETGLVQHRDIVVRQVPEGLRPQLRGLGDELESHLGPDRDASAVVAACLLARREALAAAGGFGERYHYGGEDTDLCYRIAACGGRIVTSGSAVLLHRPLSTRRRTEAGQKDVMLANQRILFERWGPALAREQAIDRRLGWGVWSDTTRPDPEASTALRYRVLGPEAPELVAALDRAGVVATGGDDDPSWLLDDVIVHTGTARHTLLDGRINVLLHDDRRPRAPTELAAHDVVLHHLATADAIVGAVEAGVARRGGPARIRNAALAPIDARCVVVLGMHRAGTSTVARLLELLGVALGPRDRLLGARAGVNDKGFFEHEQIMVLNAQVLRRFGGDWDRPPDWPDGWAADPRLDDLREEAREIVARDFPGRPVWGFKDPRTCLTLPFWLPLIGPASYVICHRHVLEVAASLERRDGLDRAAAIALWQRHLADALTASRGAPRAVISYDDPFTQPEVVLRELAHLVGDPDRADDLVVRAAVADWLDPTLVHHRHDAAELTALPGDAQALHAALDRAVAERDPAVLDGWDG